MIFFSCFFDVLIMQTLPINSYFIVANLDENKFLSVILIGLLLNLIIGLILQIFYLKISKLLLK